MNVCKRCGTPLAETAAETNTYHHECWEQHLNEWFGKGVKEAIDSMYPLGKALTERLIREQSSTNSADISAKESKSMDIEKIEIYIDGTEYRLVPAESSFRTENSAISGLTSGKFKVTLSGKVVKDWKLNTFTRKNDGSEGRVHSLLIGDDGGTIKVAAWGEHTDALKEVQEDDIVVISGGYTKDGQLKDGHQYIELHVGKRGSIAIAPPEDQA